MTASTQPDPIRPVRQAAPRSAAKNARVAAWLGGLVFSMIALSFAAVPLYDLFCRVTGFGGTPLVAEEIPDTVHERTVTVRFDAGVNRALPWDFAPEVISTEVALGAGTLMHYTATNTAARDTVGTATYNVVPLKASKYFNKVQCFCFDEQVLSGGQSVDMPVYFFVDPAFADDPHMRDVETITLSYTFFRAKSDRVDVADVRNYQGATTR